MPSNRQFLRIVTAICVLGPLVSLGVRLALGWDPRTSLYLALGLTPPLSLLWVWHLRRLKNQEWVEGAVYVTLVGVANYLLTVDLTGAFYITPYIGMLRRNVKLAAYCSGLSIAAVWTLQWLRVETTGLKPTVAQLAAHTFLLIAFGTLWAALIKFLNTQDEELVWERTASQVRQIDQMADQWAITVDARSPYTGGHVQRVTEYAMIMAPHIPNLTMNLHTFRLSCTLHDVGKIAVPDGVLNKPGPLTAEEYGIMKSHSAIGSDLVLRTGADPEIAEVVRHHHERWDGKGYPDGLKGHAIPLAARVLAVADTLDAMTTHRPYRPAMTTDQAYREINAGAGSQFDPAVVEVFRQAYPRLVETHNRRVQSA